MLNTLGKQKDAMGGYRDDDDDDDDDDDLNNLPRRKAFRMVSRKFPKNNITISQQSNVASIDIPWCVMTCWSALF